MVSGVTLKEDRNAYSKEGLDAISHQLSPDTFVNPHKNVLGLGNYDVNVMMAALQQKDYETVWFDKRLSLDILDLQHIFGFIINKPSNVNIVGVELPIKRPHWFSVRKINDIYYNLDSKLSFPECVGNEEKVIIFLTELLSLPAVQLLVIVEKCVAENTLWKKQ